MIDVVSSRRLRRVLGVTTALALSAGLLALSSCATGGSGESGEAGGGPPDGEVQDTGHSQDSTIDMKPPPSDGGVDTGKKGDSGGGGDTGPGDTGTKDTTTMDTTPPPVDTGPPDLGPPDTGTCIPATIIDAGGTPGKCSPVGSACGDIGSLSGFSPSPIPPNKPDKSACTTTAIDTIYTDCLTASGSAAACTTDQSTYTTCYDCIFSAESATSYGATILTTNGGLVLLNQSGCIDLLEPCNSNCGAAYQGLTECELAACEPNCPAITSADAGAEFQSCFNAVAVCDPGGCADYLIGADNCMTALASHPSSVCVGNAKSTFASLFKSVVPVFCGP